MAVMVQTDEQLQQEVLHELKYDARVRPNKIGAAWSAPGVASGEDRIVVSLQ